MKFLKNHPFPVEAFFESSTVLTFAVPKEELESLLPDSLELDVFDDKWAFIAVAMVQTSHLRPQGFPKVLGRDFFLIGYRIFVKYYTSAGKRLRGLYIIRSETDKGMMKLIGNIFTHYNYSQTDIEIQERDHCKTISSKKSAFHIEIKDGGGSDAELPDQSPFSTWAEARRYAGPLPFTFTFDEEQREMLIIEGVRQNWKPKPIRIGEYKSGFLNSLELNNVVLASAFEVKEVPYFWKKGKIDKWKKENRSKVF